MTQSGNGVQPESRIVIEKVKVSELVEFARSVIGAAREGQFIPITRQRALAHAHNPFAEPGDIALLVAYQETEDPSHREIVGFFGIMPIRLKRHDRFDRVYWFSTWRVMPQLRGKSVGSLLMKEALSLEEDFMIVGSGPARKVCRRFGFWEHEPLVFYQLDLAGMTRLNPATWLSRAARRLLRPFKARVQMDNRATRFVDRLLAPLGRAVFVRLLQPRLQMPSAGVCAAEVDQVRPETAEQLASQAPVEFARGAAVVNWMLKYPWVVEPGQSPTEKMDFYFSDVRHGFRMIALELFSSQDDYLGYLVLQASQRGQRGELKVLDCSLKNPGDQCYVLPLVFKYAREYKARLVDLPAEAVTGFDRTRLGRLLLVRRERIYQCHPKSGDSPLAQAWDSIQFKYTDGDMPFS
jgi:GNAT superfamily N-acetyltransferase